MKKHNDENWSLILKTLKDFQSEFNTKLQLITSEFVQLNKKNWNFSKFNHLEALSFRNKNLFKKWEFTKILFDYMLEVLPTPGARTQLWNSLNGQLANNWDKSLLSSKTSQEFSIHYKICYIINFYRYYYLSCRYFLIKKKKKLKREFLRVSNHWGPYTRKSFIE